MFFVYVVMLAASAGLVGLYARQVVAALGFTHPDLGMDALVAAGAALAYAGLELLFMALVQTLKPTRSRAAYFSESLSFLAAGVFAPYILSLPIEWPHPALAKVAPLVFLGAFVAVHGFLKLVTFFAALRSEPGPRLRFFWWLLAGGIAGLAGAGVLHRWSEAIVEARPRAPEAVQTYRRGGLPALAREMPETALATDAVDAYPGQCLSFLLAAPEDATAGAEPLERAYVTVVLEGDRTVRDTWSVNLFEDGWARFALPGAMLPPGLRQCRFLWEAEPAPRWQRVTGLRPVSHSDRRLLVAGPFLHAERVGSQGPNVVLVVVEGLGAEDLAPALRERRQKTPGLDALVARSRAYANAFTPAPEPGAACMTLLTGLNPLLHQTLGLHKGPLPASYQTLAEVFSGLRYATAAFTEGADDPPDLVSGTDAARGFELFDDTAARSAGSGSGPPDSAVTLARAKAFIELHADERFLVFVRLRELADPRWAARYGSGAGSGLSRAAPVDVYDGALAYVDKQLGDFAAFLRGSPAGRDTCLVVTSCYGLDFGTAARPLPVAGLTEDSLHVPLVFNGPGFAAGDRPAALVSLEDVAPTLYALAGAQVDYALSGNSLLEEPGERSVISMLGDPLTLSLRTAPWRFTWQSGLSPFTYQAASQELLLEFVNINRARGGVLRDEARHNPELVVKYTDQLRTYIRDNAALSKKTAPPGPGPAVGAQP